MRKSLLFRFVLVAVLILCLPLKGHAVDVGDIAPEFRTVTIDGTEISCESDLKGRKPVYLIFWSVW